uniref:Uncharacterized protein n=1 Tax=Amphimedon queenslandica TaxID=400682 RepID=A0A1X7TWN2_AMPQE
MCSSAVRKALLVGAVLVSLASLITGITLICLVVQSPQSSTYASSYGDSESNSNQDAYVIQSELSSHQPYMINISLNGTKEELDGVKVEVDGTSENPVKVYRNLSTKISYLSGPNEIYNYNYYGGDQFIYLSLGSYLIYNFSFSGSITSNCPAKLYAFNDYENYDSFRNERPFTASSSSPCLFVNSVNSWQLKGSDKQYYVGLNISDNITLKSNISGIQYYYNTTGLSSYNFCHLSDSNRECIITRCNYFLCSGPKSNTENIFIKPNGPVTLIQMYTTPHVYGGYKFWGFIVSIVAFFCAFVCMFVCVCVCIMLLMPQKERKGYESIKSRSGSIN